MARQALLLLAALASVGPRSASAATCTEVPLNGPYAPKRLMKCVNGIDVRRTTDPNSCPKGWKIWAPESREDWQTVINSGVLPVRNPHFIIDITRPSNGCGGCRNPMNSDHPSQSSWKTTNGEKWWLRSTGYGEPNGNYHANCYLNINSWSNVDNIRFDDGNCDYHSRDYLCQPESKVDCSNRTDEITGPCKSEAAVFRHSNCTPGVCEQGKYLVFKGKTTIEECQKLCSDGRVFSPVPSGLTEKVYYFRQNGQYQDVSTRTPDLTRIVDTVNYPNTGGHFSGLSHRDHFYMQWTGTINIKTAGSYGFQTRSDDGSFVKVDGTTVLDNGGWHGMQTRSGTIDLTAGSHSLLVEYFEGGGGSGMELKWWGPDTGNQHEFIPKEAFVNPGGTEYELSGLFKKHGPCMAYSMSSDERCLIYTQCPSVGTGSVCDAGLNHLGSLDDFKTCQFSAPQLPAAGSSPAPAPSGGAVL